MSAEIKTINHYTSLKLLLYQVLLYLWAPVLSLPLCAYDYLKPLHRCMALICSPAQSTFI